MTKLVDTKRKKVLAKSLPYDCNETLGILHNIAKIPKTQNVIAYREVIKEKRKQLGCPESIYD